MTEDPLHAPPNHPLGSGPSFETALLALPPDWSFSHLIALGEGSFQAILVDPHYVVVGTGDSPGWAVTAAAARTLEPPLWMPKALLASALPRRSLDEILNRKPKQVLRRI